MVQGVVTVALMAQVVTVLEPDYRLLLRPDVQQKVALTPPQLRKITQAMQTAEDAYRRMGLSERTSLANDAAEAKELLVLPAMHGLGLTKIQRSHLVALTIQSYGPFLLKMPGMEYHLKISQKQKVGLNRDFSEISTEFNNRFAVQAQKSKTKYTPGGPVPLSPPFQVIKAERDRVLWLNLLKHLTGPQIMRVIIARKNDPWAGLK
jgi:hypothetical protein